MFKNGQQQGSRFLLWFFAVIVVQNLHGSKSLNLRFSLFSFSMCSTSTFVHLHGVEWIHKHQTYHDLQENFTKSKVRQEMGLITVEHCCCCLPTNFVGSTMGFSSTNACENVRNISWKKAETQLTSAIVEQHEVTYSTSFHTFHTFLQIPVRKLQTPLHTDDPVACTASGGWHPSRASGPTILAMLCNGQEAWKSDYFCYLQIYQICDQQRRVDVQVWKMHMKKKEQTKDALLNGKQNSHPFQNTFTWSQYFPCCTISSWIVIDMPFKCNRIGHAPAESQRNCPMLASVAWACVGPVFLVRSDQLAKANRFLGTNMKQKFTSCCSLCCSHLLFARQTFLQNENFPRYLRWRIQLSSLPTWDCHRRLKSLKVCDYMHASSRLLGTATQSLLKDQMA